MLNVSEATKTAYAGSSVPKSLKISFPDRNIVYTNADIISESFSLQEVLENDSNLTFKGCIASQCKFKVVGLVTDLRGEWVEVTIQAGDPEEIDEIPLFAGYVDSQDNETHTDISTELTCYDPLYIHSDLPAHHRYLPACRQDRHQGHRCCERYRLDSHAVIRSTICAESHEASETICPIKRYGLHISAGRFCFIRSAFQKRNTQSHW